MRFFIAGAGAIGAYVGALMSRAGFDVTLFARGPHLQAMRNNGVQIESSSGDFASHPEIAGSLEDLGPFDVIFLAVKAHSLVDLAPQLRPLIGPDTTVVSMQNGLPWWLFQGFGGNYDGLRLERVDPGGVIATSIPASRVLGSIVYFSTEIIAPGVIHHTQGNRISLGEPDGIRSDRSRSIAEALIASGLRAPITTHIRNEIFVKILGNVAFNPVSALTRSTLAQMTSDPDVCHLVREIMLEAAAVAAKLGLELPVSIDQRIAGAARVGEHKTSMLQDLEAGRPLELEAIVGSLVELGERLAIPMPHTRTVYSCTKLLHQSMKSTGAPHVSMSFREMG